MSIRVVLKDGVWSIALGTRMAVTNFLVGILLKFESNRHCSPRLLHLVHETPADVWRASQASLACRHAVQLFARLGLGCMVTMNGTSERQRIVRSELVVCLR